jgi:hypothetical protein
MEHDGSAALDCVAIDAQLARARNQVVSTRGELERAATLVDAPSRRVEPRRGPAARKLDPDLLRASRQTEEEQQRWADPAHAMTRALRRRRSARKLST